MAINEQRNEELWAKYLVNKDIAPKKELMLSYIGLVKYAVQGMHLPNNSILHYEDFINIGMLGLSDAIERFDKEKGVKFETYAMTRIKGVVLDELRKLDWLSRTARKRAQDLMHAEDELRKKQGADVTTEQIMKKLNINESEYQVYLQAAAAAKANQYLNENSQGQLGEDDFDILEEVPDDSLVNTLDKLENEERVNNISKILTEMPEKKRLVIMLYYYEEMNFKAIGNVLNLTESRVCQIHAQVIKEIKDKLNKLENA